MSDDCRRGVRLWTLDLDGMESPHEGWLELLGEEERARCQRFRQAKDRLAYAAAHALLRRVLGQALGLPPESLTFQRDAMGKPFLDQLEIHGIDFSLSHTDGMVAVAINGAGKVGVDVEAVDRKAVPLEDYPAFGISREELERLDASPEPERTELFLDMWTAREAVAKADGRGLSLHFSHIHLDVAGAMAAVTAGSGHHQYRLWRERPTPRHCLSLAWPGDTGGLTAINRMNASILDSHNPLPVTSRLEPFLGKPNYNG